MKAHNFRLSTINRFAKASPARVRKPHLMESSRASAALAQMAKGNLENVLEMAWFFDAIKDLGRRVGPEVSLDRILHTILELACKLLRANRGDFVGPDWRSQELVHLALWGPQPKNIREGYPLPSSGFINNLLRSRKNYGIAGDVRKVRHYHACDKRTRSEIAFKFQTPQGRYFVLNLESFRPNFFNHEDIRLLALLLPYVEARVAQAEGREILALYKDLIVGNLQEMVYVKDVMGRYVFVSRNLAEFLGVRDPQEVIGKKDEDFFKRHPKMIAAFLKDDQKVMKTGKSSDWFHELCQPDCQPVPWRINTVKAPVFASDSIANLIAMASGTQVQPVEANNGRKVVGVIGTFHDVSRDALELAQVLTRTGCILWRKRTNRVDVSDSTWDIFGIPVKDRIGDPSADVGALSNSVLTKIELEDRAKLIAGYFSLLDQVNARTKRKGCESIRLDTPFVFKLAGKERWLRLSYENSLEIENDPESQVAVVVVQDVTELQTSIRDLQQAKDRMTRANQSLVLGALSRATLHDARRPIDQLPPAVDNMVASLRKLDKLSAPERKARVKEDIETLEMLKKECIMARENIEHLRELSIDPNRIRREKVDLIELLKECEWVEGPDLEKRSIKVIQSIKPGKHRLRQLPSVRGDKLALRVAFGNLLRNAIICGCPEGSRKQITITVEHDRNRKGGVVKIRDSGPGFPPEIIEHIKDPFSVPINPKGMGFGLLISKTLFFLMGGKLEVFPGPGASCQVFLPQFGRFTKKP